VCDSGRSTGTNVAKPHDVVSRPKRLANRSYIGPARYFLTFCVRDRGAAFEDSTAAAEALAHFLRAAEKEKFSLSAYCLMPDHAHLLVQALDATSDLRHFVKFAKERSGRAYRKRCDKRLWQEGYFERVLRDDSEAREYARYIVNNPVRAGLVRTVMEYEFVGATEWTLEELTEVVPDEQVTPTS
jgi:putative transposase